MKADIERYRKAEVERYMYRKHSFWAWIFFHLKLITDKNNECTKIHCAKIEAEM